MISHSILFFDSSARLLRPPALLILSSDQPSALFGPHAAGQSRAGKRKSRVAKQKAQNKKENIIARRQRERQQSTRTLTLRLFDCFFRPTARPLRPSHCQTKCGKDARGDAVHVVSASSKRVRAPQRSEERTKGVGQGRGRGGRRRRKHRAKIKRL